MARRLAPVVLALLAACGSSETAEVTLRIHAVEPSEGSARGGDVVTVRGAGFDGGTRVFFGDEEAAEIRVVSEAELEVTTPRHLARTVSVSTKAGDRSATREDAYTFVPLVLSFQAAPAWYLPDLGNVAASDAVSADFTGDGYPDLLVAARNEPSILLVNSGTGSFVGVEATPSFDAGVQDPGAGDAGDGGASEGGVADAEPSDAHADSVQPGVPGAVEAWVNDTARVLVDDFDGDGSPDVFACNRGGQSHRLLINDGEGSLKLVSGAVPAFADECQDAWLVDLDQDGHRDIVVLAAGKVGAGKSYLRVYLRDPEQPGPAFVAEGFEADDAPDGSPCGTVNASTPEATVTANTSASSPPQGKAACDLAFDTAGADAAFAAWFPCPSVPWLPDAVELRLRAGSAGDVVKVRVRDKDGEVFAQEAASVGTSWKLVRADDLEAWKSESGEGDGVMDVPLTEVGVWVKPSSSAGTLGVDDIRLDVPLVGGVFVDDFERKSFAHAWDAPATSVAAGDLDGDGLPELLIGSHAPGQAPSLVMLRNETSPGEGKLAFGASVSGVIEALPDPIRGLAVYDVDGDGDLDVMAGALGGQDRYLSNDGNGHFFDDTLAMMPVDRADSRALSLADLDMDGRADLLVANDDAVDRLYLNRGEKGFVDATPSLPMVLADTRRLVPLDADGDGDLDLIVLGAGGAPSKLLVSVEEVAK